MGQTWVEPYNCIQDNIGPIQIYLVNIPSQLEREDIEHSNWIETLKTTMREGLWWKYCHTGNMMEHGEPELFLLPLCHEENVYQSQYVGCVDVVQD